MYWPVCCPHLPTRSGIRLGWDGCRFLGCSDRGSSAAKEAPRGHKAQLEATVTWGADNGAHPKTPWRIRCGRQHTRYWPSPEGSVGRTQRSHSRKGHGNKTGAAVIHCAWQSPGRRPGKTPLTRAHREARRRRSLVYFLTFVLLLFSYL